MAKELWKLKNKIKYIKENIVMIKNAVMESYQIRRDKFILEILKMIWNMDMENIMKIINATLKDIGWIIKEQKIKKIQN